MALSIRISSATFAAHYAGRYGLWRSRKMVAACNTLLDFETTKPTGTTSEIRDKEVAMINAWYIWSTTKEFRKLNVRMNGTCKKLAVEMGVLPGIDRESNTTAFVLTGERRVEPTARKSPAVAVTNLTIPAYIEKMSLEGNRGGIVLIDAFGDVHSAVQAHGFNRRFGNQETTLMENIEVILDTAKDFKLQMFNVTMNTSKTWKSLVDKFPTNVTDIIKPRQGLFDDTGGAEDYFTKTKLKFKGVDYVVVMGWDANQCVASAIFGVERNNLPYVPGLVDLGIDVVTSRNVLAANGRELESQWGWPYLGPPPR